MQDKFVQQEVDRSLQARSQMTKDCLAKGLDVLLLLCQCVQSSAQVQEGLPFFPALLQPCRSFIRGVSIIEAKGQGSMLSVPHTAFGCAIMLPPEYVLLDRTAFQLVTSIAPSVNPINTFNLKYAPFSGAAGEHVGCEQFDGGNHVQCCVSNSRKYHTHVAGPPHRQSPQAHPLHTQPLHQHLLLRQGSPGDYLQQAFPHLLFPFCLCLPANCSFAP